MEELARLRQEHAELAKMFRRLGEIIDRPQPPEQVELFELRRELVSTLLAHLKFEDWGLYPRLIDSDDSTIADTARAFKEEMGGLAPAFLAYCDKWNAGTINADWQGYCADTRSILDALTNRLTRENRELLPLLEKLDKAA